MWNAGPGRVGADERDGEREPQDARAERPLAAAKLQPPRADDRGDEKPNGDARRWAERQVPVPDRPTQEGADGARRGEGGDDEHSITTEQSLEVDRFAVDARTSLGARAADCATGWLAIESRRRGRAGCATPRRRRRAPGWCARARRCALRSIRSIRRPGSERRQGQRHLLLGRALGRRATGRTTTRHDVWVETTNPSNYTRRTRRAAPGSATDSRRARFARAMSSSMRDDVARDAFSSRMVGRRGPRNRTMCVRAVASHAGSGLPTVRGRRSPIERNARSAPVGRSGLRLDSVSWRVHTGHENQEFGTWTSLGFTGMIESDTVVSSRRRWRRVHRSARNPTTTFRDTVSSFYAVARKRPSPARPP